MQCVHSLFCCCFLLWYDNICLGAAFYSSSNSSHEVLKVSASAFSSMSVTNRSPLSILWTAFLSTSIPYICKHSATIPCDIFGVCCFRNTYIYSPQMLLFPFDDLFLNINCLLLTFSAWQKYLNMIWYR